MMSPVLQVLMGWAGSFGFSLLFNVRGWKLIFASLGGAFSWLLYLLMEPYFPSEMLRYFLSATFVAVYAEILARVLKTPATTFLIPSIIPHIPGGALYYTMNYAVQGQMDLFASRGMFTAAIAGIMAVGILLGSTVFRMYADWKARKRNVIQKY